MSNLNGPGKPAYPPPPVSIALQPSRAGPPPPIPPHTQPGRQHLQQVPPSQTNAGYQGPYPTVLIPQPPKTIGSFRPAIARPPRPGTVPVQVPPPGSGPVRLPLEVRDFLSVGKKKGQTISYRLEPLGEPPAPISGPTVLVSLPASAPAPAPAPTPVPVITTGPPPIPQGRGPALAPAPIPPPEPAPPPPPPPNPNPPRRGPGRPPLKSTAPAPALARAPALAPPPPKRPTPDTPGHPPPPPKRVRPPEEYQIDLTKLPDVPPYLTTPPDICNPVMTSNDAAVPTEFSWSMRVLTLTRIDQVDLWATQVEEMAKACGCYREMTTRFGAFPKPGTVEAFICQTRYAACWRILTETISGPVWAYMRALGYSKIPLFRGDDGIQWQPAPVDAFYYAKQAGYRLSNPGSPSQSREEIMRMVEELRVGQPADYPSQSQFGKGHHWMKEVLDNLIRKGDRQVCDSLYDTPPMFAPIWIGPPRPEEYRWNLPGAPLHGKTQKRHRSVEVHLAQQRQQQLAEREQQWIRMDESQRSGQYTVIPSNMAPPPTPPPPARAPLPEQPRPGQYHSHPQPPPFPGPGPGPYVQQPPPPPPGQGQYVSPYGPVGHPPHPLQQQQQQQQQQYARPPTVPSQAPPQGQGQGGPPPQPQQGQGQGPPQNMNRQIPQQTTTQGQVQQQSPAQPTEVITIPDTPMPIETPQDMSTPPPLFTEEEDNADDDDDNEKSDDGGGGGVGDSGGGNTQTQTDQDQVQEQGEGGGNNEEGERGEDQDEDEDEEEETFHDAEEGNNGNGSGNGNEGSQDGDVIMADGDGDGDDNGGNDPGQATGQTPGGEAGEAGEEAEGDSEEGDGEEEESEEE